MSSFAFQTTKIEGLRLIAPIFTCDQRGYFSKAFERELFAEHGIRLDVAEELETCSACGTLRGLHFQHRHSQDKLVRVMSGQVYDVAVDLREGSPTLGKWFGVILSAENKKQFFVPEGFAHGFLVLSDYAEFCYKVTDFYHPNDEGGLLWEDPEIGIEWPIPEGMSKADLILSEKDRKWDTFGAWKKGR